MTDLLIKYSLEIIQYEEFENELNLFLDQARKLYNKEKISKGSYNKIFNMYKQCLRK